MKGMPRQTARCAFVETGYIPSHQRNATPNGSVCNCRDGIHPVSPAECRAKRLGVQL
ncbi:MAG: hypothetical protein IKQ77_15550 [Prevotella sp.]|nr:hypothetical protein [Prevotella sp.]